ncbi:hypothetical protein [Dehalococcoides mccartyi]|uniref:hypothetical protein n=1 Tax=Dehalococcoides mccartyi TaxID=61435 RepID=UPI00059DB4E9|nr:hypothetical protein [Dehalococcoides mccartyi]
MWSLYTMIWMLIGIALGVGFTALINMLNKRGISVRFYEWLIGIAGLVLFLFTIQNFYTAFQEFYTKAAWMFLLVTGIPAVILLAISWQLFSRRVSNKA